MAELRIFDSDGWRSLPLESMGSVHVAEAKPWDGARAGKCYANVRAMIGRHGGEAVYGWALTDFGPHRAGGGSEPPLYRRWLNHVVWRDREGRLWEVTPNAVLDDLARLVFHPTEMLIDAEAVFEVVSDEEWFTQPTRYVPVRPEGVAVANLLTQAQLATSEAERHDWLKQALAAIEAAGFQPREWKVETIGERTGSIWLIAE